MSTHEFRHIPRAPHIVDGYEDQRNFSMPGGASGLHLGIMRHAKETLARIEVSTWADNNVRASCMAKLTADQCEAAARAFIDAAHDLRTHNSLTALHNAIAAAEGAGS